jgi:hypothetical protein
MTVLAVLFAMAFVGCSEETIAPTLDITSIEASTIAVDPLADALDSTDGSTPGDPSARIDRLAEVLGLDEAQKEALLAAYTEFRDARADLRDQVIAGEITLEEARAQAQVLRDAFEAELQIILTPEQYEMLQDMRRHRHRNETAMLLRDEFDAALQAILTAEQYEALLALRPDKCKR